MDNQEAKNNNENKKKLVWGTAKIEFASLLPEIKKLVEGEYPKTRIYAVFFDNNRLTMSYRRFCELVCKHFPERYGKPKNYLNPETTDRSVTKNNEDKKPAKSNTESVKTDKNENKVENAPVIKKPNVVEAKNDDQFGNSASTDDLKKLMGG